MIDCRKSKTNMSKNRLINIRNIYDHTEYTARIDHTKCMLIVIWLNIYISSISKINTIKIKFLRCCFMHAEVNRLSGNKVPRELLCPITLDIMEDPVVDSFGHTYERQEIETWLGFPPYPPDPLLVGRDFPLVF